MIDFGDALRTARHAAGLTQTALAARSGVARPNVVAYETGRREPLFHNAVALLDATGARVRVDAAVSWSWSEGLRPYAVPSRLWRLDPEIALRRLELGPHLWWSGSPRSFHLLQRDERLRAYEIVLREGSPEDIETTVDGLLLCDAWPELVLPRALRAAWEHLVPPAARARPVAA